MAFLAQLSWLILSTMAANENFVEHVRSYNKKKKNYCSALRSIYLSLSIVQEIL